MTADLAAFLTAQLDEIERVARAATPGPWINTNRSGRGECLIAGRQVADPTAHTQVGVIWGWRHSQQDATHIALHDPVFVLAWVAVQREIVAELAPEVSRLDDVYEGEAGPGDSRISDALLLALARPFRGRPGWRDEWGTGNGG